MRGRNDGRRGATLWFSLCARMGASIRPLPRFASCCSVRYPKRVADPQPSGTRKGEGAGSRMVDLQGTAGMLNCFFLL